MRRVARLEMSGEFVVDILQLPEGAKLLGCVYDPHEYKLCLLIEDASFPEVAEGTMPPRAKIYYRTHSFECGHRVTTAKTEVAQ